MVTDLNNPEGAEPTIAIDPERGEHLVGTTSINITSIEHCASNSFLLPFKLVVAASLNPHLSPFNLIHTPAALPCVLQLLRAG